MAHTHDPKNPHPPGTADYWKWHNQMHPRPEPRGQKADAARRRKFFGGK